MKHFHYMDMPKFNHLKKEVREGSGSCRIYDCRSYDKSLATIDAFWEIALQDFPKLTKEHCTIVQYGPPSHQYMMGLHFVAPSEIPADYATVWAFDPEAS